MAALPRIMGILNITPDSFSSGRSGSADDMLAAAVRMMAEGAAVIDVGGESTRPGAEPVPEAEELRRVLPVLERLAAAGIPFSIDSRKAAVLAAAAGLGAAMLNDVSALCHDPRSLEVAAAASGDVVLMHMQGEPQSMQQAPHYIDVEAEVGDWLAQRIAVCEAAGIARARLIADPGIGFGKTLAHNLALLRGLEGLRERLGVPLLLGASRKSVIPAIAGPAPVGRRLGGSIALALRGADAGCAWVRVHDVAETAQALAVWAAARC